MGLLLGTVIVTLALSVGLAIVVIANNSVQQFNPDRYINFIAPPENQDDSIKLDQAS